MKDPQLVLIIELVQHFSFDFGKNMKRSGKTILFSLTKIHNVGIRFGFYINILRTLDCLYCL